MPCHQACSTTHPPSPTCKASRKRCTVTFFLRTGSLLLMHFECSPTLSLFLLVFSCLPYNPAAIITNILILMHMSQNLLSFAGPITKSSLSLSLSLSLYLSLSLSLRLHYLPTVWKKCQSIKWHILRSSGDARMRALYTLRRSKDAKLTKRYAATIELECAEASVGSGTLRPPSSSSHRAGFGCSCSEAAFQTPEEGSPSNI